MNEVSIRAYLGGEKWGEPRAVPHSATNFDPVAVGGGERGCVFLRRATGWVVVRFDAAKIDEPVSIPESIGVAACDLSGIEIGGKILVASRHDDGALSTRWLHWDAAGLAGEDGPKLDFTSDVPVGIGKDAKSGRLVFVGAGRNADQKPICTKIAWFEIEADGSWKKTEERFIGGEHDTVHCTTRPTVRITGAGELYLFHTGWPDENGQMTAWRTQMLPTRELRDGWLVCMLYDIWTKTRRAVAWEIGPQGAVYAYRWDAGGDVNKLQTAFNGLGIDTEPMRDFDDGALVSKWGIRQSILNMRR
jgi:hypothetical protein